MSPAQQDSKIHIILLDLGFGLPFLINHIARQDDDLIRIILLFDIQQVRNLRTALVSLAFPEMNDDDAAQKFLQSDFFAR